MGIIMFNLTYCSCNTTALIRVELLANFANITFLIEDHGLLTEALKFVKIAVINLKTLLLAHGLSMYLEGLWSCSYGNQNPRGKDPCPN